MKMKICRETGKTIIDISEDEIKILEEKKEELIQYFEDFLIYEREDIYFELSTYITNESIRSYLNVLRHNVIHVLYYNTEFKNVVFIINGKVEFSKDDNFYYFASAYNLLDDTSRAQRVLSNILKVQLIDWIIENDFKNDNAKDFVLNISDSLTSLDMINNDSFPFKESKHYKYFKKYIESKFIIDVYKDYGYLFQRLKHEKFIDSVKHLDFAKWLLDNSYIKDFEYKNIFEKGGFRSLEKNYSIVRENNFNNIFEL